MTESRTNREDSDYLKELEQLKEVDYEFYEYLKKNDEALLGPIELENNIANEDCELLNSESIFSELTRERFNQIKENLKTNKSLREINLLLSCFKSVASINHSNEKQVLEGSAMKSDKKRKRTNTNKLDKKRSQSEVSLVFQVEDSELAFEIIKFVLNEIHKLFWFYSSNGKSYEEYDLNIELKNLPKWNKIEKSCRSFWKDVSNLLLYNCLISEPNFELMNYVFDKLSNPSLILWLIPNKVLTNRFSMLLSRIWTMNKYLILKKEAFKVLKSINATFERFCLLSDSNGKKLFNYKDKSEVLNSYLKRHEEFLLILHRIIGLAALRGVSWKNYFSTRQIIEEYIVLLEEIDFKKVYRIAFNIIRNLGSLLRILFVRISRTNSHDKLKKNTTKQKKQFEEVYSNIYSWKFLVIIRIWTRALIKIKELFQLQYPIITIIISTIKLNLNSIVILPFTLQCLDILTQLSLHNRCFIPISEILFNLHSIIEKGFKQSYSRNNINNLRSQSLINTSSKPFVPEFEIRIGNSILKSTQVFDSLQEYWLYIFILYLSTMKKNYSYPEFLLPIIPNIKRLIKYNSKYWNDQMMMETKEMIKRLQQHSDFILDHRINTFNQKSNDYMLNYEKNGNSSLDSTYSFIQQTYNFLELTNTNSSIHNQIQIMDNYIQNKINKREELISNKIKLFSTKNSNNSYYDYNEDDYEFKSLIQQLQKAGKTIDDLRHIGPRQLKKIKKSIKNKISDLEHMRRDVPNQNSNSLISRTDSIKRNRDIRDSIGKVQNLTSDNYKECYNTFSNINKTIQQDTIEDWKISSDEDN